MGVRYCDRNGCHNVMCDYRVCGKDICWQCLAEFRNRNAHLIGNDFECVFEAFMNSKKTNYRNTTPMVDIWLKTYIEDLE